MKEEAYVWIESVQFTDWWYNARRRVVQAFMEHMLGPAAGNLRVLDVGSGFGSMIPMLVRYGAVDAIEPHPRAREALSELGVGRVFASEYSAQRSGRRYDVATMFDVLEHIEDDRSALDRVLSGLLDERGKLIVTVPAYQWLYSQHDVHNGHFRRYTAGGLMRTMREAGFTKVRGSYFMTILFPVAASRRLWIKSNPAATKDSPVLSPGVNAFCEAVFSAEAALVRRVSLPYGLSVVACGERAA